MNYENGGKGHSSQGFSFQAPPAMGCILPGQFAPDRPGRPAGHPGAPDGGKAGDSVEDPDDRPMTYEEFADTFRFILAHAKGVIIPVNPVKQDTAMPRIKPHKAAGA